MEIKNAVIESVTLEKGDRGLLQCWLHLSYGGSGQGFGGYALYLPKSFAHHSMQSVAGHFMFRCMEVAGVDNWADMAGRTIRVRADNGKVYAIGHIVKDDWFDPAEDFSARSDADEESEALRDMLDIARADMEMLREALGVPAEPHQSLIERMVEAAQAKRGAVPEGWREDVYLAAQMLTWADDDGGLTDQQDRAIRAHQKKMFAMLAAAPAPDQLRDAAEMVAKSADDAVRPHPYGRNCQKGGDVCLASKADGIVCPDDSCDIDTGVRSTPAPAEVPSQHAGARMGTEEGGEAYTAGYFDGEAAGYAKGLAESGPDAKRYRFITDDHADSDVRRAVSAVCDAIVIRGKGATDAAIDALREKAKPAKCDGNHGGPRCADLECWQDPAGAVIDVRTEAERLVKSALAVGVVLTIETQPRQPLAMGNYDLVVQTREVRNG